jgi:hypothetical protein
MHCDENYPDKPPTIQFISRVNLPFVSQTNGKVDPSKLPVLANWNRNSSIETVLVEIRRFVLSYILPPSALVLRFFTIAASSHTHTSMLDLERWLRSTIASFPNLPKALPSNATTRWPPSSFVSSTLCPPRHGRISVSVYRF